MFNDLNLSSQEERYLIDLDKPLKELPNDDLEKISNLVFSKMSKIDLIMVSKIYCIKDALESDKCENFMKECVEKIDRNSKAFTPIASEEFKKVWSLFEGRIKQSNGYPDSTISYLLQRSSSGYVSVWNDALQSILYGKCEDVQKEQGTTSRNIRYLWNRVYEESMPELSPIINVINETYKKLSEDHKS